MIPMIFFASTILSLTGIARGLEGLLEEDEVKSVSDKNGMGERRENGPLVESDFYFVDRGADETY
jgi:peptide/nickel transport system permease protein